mgnify:CR=1 FL=1
MIKLLLHSWLFSSHSLAGVSQQQSVLSRMLQFLKKRYRVLNMKYKTLKFLRRRKIARRKFQTTEKGVQVLIIILVLAVLLLAGCSYRMVPNETKIEYGTTETDAKNSKLQEKKFITQTWKWK